MRGGRRKKKNTFTERTFKSQYAKRKRKEYQKQTSLVNFGLVKRKVKRSQIRDMNRGKETGNRLLPV